MRIDYKKTYITLLVVALAFAGAAFYTTSEVKFVQESDANSLTQLRFLDLQPVSPAPVMEAADTNAVFDAIIEQFLDRWSIKGASVAVMKDNKLIFSKGYGFADLDMGEEMDTHHMLRIASVSKLITAIGIMKLVEQGKLYLNDTIFGSTGILSEYQYFKDEKHKNITVKDLLNHRGGWSWRDGDFMFQAPKIQRIMGLPGSPTAHDIIEFVLRKRRLRYEPGTQYAYSNFGYMLLGEIIKETTGNSYEQYIKQEILEPNGIKGMHLAGNYEWDRLSFESRYYDYPTAYKYPSFDGNYEDVPKPYGGSDIKTLGAAGGWIANASQLVKLVALIDPTYKYGTVLSTESIDLMLGCGEYRDAYGWKDIDGEDWLRTGTLAGSSSVIFRRGDGFTYAVILNSSVWMGYKFNEYIQGMMDESILTLKHENAHDYFWQNTPKRRLLPTTL